VVDPSKKKESLNEDKSKSMDHIFGDDGSSLDQTAEDTPQPK
jgi:hypothetical protein